MWKCNGRACPCCDGSEGLLPIYLAESYNSYALCVTCAKLYYSTLAQGTLPLHGDLEDIQQFRFRMNDDQSNLSRMIRVKSMAKCIASCYLGSVTMIDVSFSVFSSH
jgi:hypothetical protein